MDNEPLYTACSECLQFTRSDLIMAVQAQETRGSYIYTFTRWLCSTCRRNMSRNEQGEENVQTESKALR